MLVENERPKGVYHKFKVILILKNTFLFFAYYSEAPKSERPKSKLHRNPNLHVFGIQTRWLRDFVASVLTMS